VLVVMETLLATTMPGLQAGAMEDNLFELKD
jgi:hypothetical protein